jgi:hypothetical protein
MSDRDAVRDVIVFAWVWVLFEPLVERFKVSLSDPISDLHDVCLEILATRWVAGPNGTGEGCLGAQRLSWKEKPMNRLLALLMEAKVPCSEENQLKLDKQV